MHLLFDAPSTFNLFVDHLTLQQRRRIKAMGFGGLLYVSAERLESRELLKFLFDRLDPKTMVINVTKDKGIHVTPFVVKLVLDLPEGSEDIDLHAHIQASKVLSAFKTLLGLEESHNLHASHLQNTLKDDRELGSGTITDHMAIRFFFIIACNKLMFPSTDNNIRCKDVYMTRDLSCLLALNWCKAVVDDFREAALTWQADKAKKSFSGCARLPIILYLGNLECRHQIEHTDTPRVKYFRQNLRNNIDTCYHTSLNPSSNTPPSIEPLATTCFLSMEAELRGLVDEISGGPRKTQAMLALASFDTKAKKASSYISIGQQILSDAHQAAIRTLQEILNDEMHGNNSEDHDNQPHTCDAPQADDVDMYDGHNAQNVGSEHVFGGTNQELNQGIPEGLQQNKTQEQDLPPSEALHDIKAPQIKAHAVRKKFHTAMKCKSDIFICTGLREFSGSEISESFLDGEMLSTQFMSYFVACMSYDECHMADGGGYRVFLSQELGGYVNIEEDEDFSQWESHQALVVLQRDIEDLDPTKVKLFLLPVMEEEHYNIYCINFIHDRIDLATDFKIKQFTRFKRPIIDVCMHSHDSDCGFYAIKFMKLWNGDSFHVLILTVSLTIFTKTQCF
uniref:Ubiquitin-like protease family profile domain-containing protein n=1 Tax=Setaria viridis TaxID=4556 RepID=A0A4U6U5D7_SETVI|nr:hypothetical protein SEVIR_6G195700v2 [Setaria viridis]